MNNDVQNKVKVNFNLSCSSAINNLKFNPHKESKNGIYVSVKNPRE